MTGVPIFVSVRCFQEIRRENGYEVLLINNEKI